MLCLLPFSYTPVNVAYMFIVLRILLVCMHYAPNSWPSSLSQRRTNQPLKHCNRKQGSGIVLRMSWIDTENIIVLMLTFPKGSGEGDSRRNAVLIGKVDFRL